MRFHLKEELKKLSSIIKKMDRKVIIVFLSVAILQTISWYFTSRLFFRYNLFNYFSSSQNVDIYEFIYWFIGDFFSLFLLPLLVILLVLKGKPKSFGLQLGDYKAGLKIAFYFIMIMLFITWIASASSSFVETYPLLKRTKTSWGLFFIFETGMLLYLFAWEFIWRGFMLFGLEEKFGFYAVLIQMIPFVILHNGKPPVETFSAILGGIALGILAFRTRSFLYCVIVHMSVMFTIDLFSTLRYRVADYGIGISSLIHIIKEIF
ncbi:MAG TPA: CPBP family intramembrane glutamic endopeptidase [Ignavibacteriaceae bacterium]|nr:CPBP family intramembrane glutamic endopeptidase [Ignavibacteriaceae bacterium]